ncbi:Wzz/FepE/Etk N-terminal domain-containing protein [Gammaproteobacteria bacterium]|nr:Wzz/FepE/Etk N-terminal domain-containing protein [Gammaproteobacteria bacterium]
MIENKKYDNNEIDLFDLYLTLWDKKILIGAITSVMAIISVIYSLNLSNFYISESQLVPSAQDKSLSSSFGGLASLGSIAGVSMPAGNVSKSQEAIERIKSFEFFSKHLLPEIKLANIIAVKKWLPDENILIYKDTLYNDRDKKWLKSKPSDQEAYKIYKKIMVVNEDIKTSFVTVSIEHKSPIIAQRWVDLIISQINESMRISDSNDAKEYINFLSATSQSANIKSLKEVLANLLEDQMQILMLASSNDNYVFKIIDSAIVPEQKAGPSRAIICILGTLLGLMLSLTIVFIQKLRNSSTYY